MITRLLCKLGFHKWLRLFGLAPEGYHNYQCRRCGAKKYRRYHHDYEKQWERWERNHEARERYFASGGEEDEHG